MITFEDFTKMFSVDLNGEMCIEVEFNIIGLPDFQNCWMGKMPDPDKKVRDIYWFGIPNHVQDDYSYDDFTDFSESPVFAGKSLKELWDYVELLSIDGCDPDERIQFYLNYLN